MSAKGIMKSNRFKFIIFCCLISVFPAFGQAVSEKSAAVSEAKAKIFEIVRAKRQSGFPVLIKPEDLQGLSAAEQNALTAPQGPCDSAVTIGFGQTLYGQLTSSDCPVDDGSYADFYAFYGNQGQHIVVSMNSSAFDTYEGIANQDGTFALEDDDGGDGTNSRIITTLPATGLYIIIANSVLPAAFGDYTISVTADIPCSYALEPTSANVPAAGGTFSFNIITQPGCFWSASTTDFYYLSTSSAGTGSGTVFYNAEVSTSATTRTGTIRVGGQTFTVTQPPLVCSYSISQTSLTAPATGASGTFIVNAPDGCPWSATSSDYFLWSDNYGRGTSTIRYTVATNNGADRTGKITVNGLNFNVTQPGLNCTFSVSPTNIAVDRFEHTGTITVNTQPGCEWSANGGGFELQNGFGHGAGSFTYRIYANTGIAPRSGVIGFYGLGLIRIYVNQSGFPFRTRFDYDGDRKADISVFRPSNSVWYMNRTNGGFSAVSWGNSTDVPVPADYDGDGKTDVAVYRQGIWYIIGSYDGTFIINSFGQAGDVPQPVDFDGDGRAELAVYRPNGGFWYSLNLANNQFNAYSFGAAGDKPVAADYDGDGKADYAVYRPETGIWYLQQTNKGFAAISFGLAEDKPVPADYDGDGKTDVAVYRSGNWYELRSSGGFYAVSFGDPTDLAAPADYDGDGKTDEAIYRGGQWFMLQSIFGLQVVSFGDQNDKPISNSFIQ